MNKEVAIHSGIPKNIKLILIGTIYVNSDGFKLKPQKWYLGRKHMQYEPQYYAEFLFVRGLCIS